MAQYVDKSSLLAEIERRKNKNVLTNEGAFEEDIDILSFLNTLAVKDVDYERELSKYVSNGIHRFFPNVDDDYCKMDSVIWQDYVIETAKHFFELGLQAQKGE